MGVNLRRWVAMLAFLLAFHASSSVALAAEAPSCDDLPSLGPDEDHCAFVRAHCDSEGLVPFLNIYFCHVRPHGRLLAALSLLTCSAALIVLFRVMGRAADDYFSSILSQISQEMGLPPRLGGVTLLALGNGAPDLSSSIAAVRSGNYPLAVGALAGGSMFVGCVVAGRIVTLSGGVRAKWAQIRDVTTHFLAVATVTAIFALGKMTYGAVAALLSMYGAYVLVVAIADIGKRVGIEWNKMARGVSKRIQQRFRQASLLSPLLRSRSRPMSPSGSTPSDFLSDMESEVESVGALTPVEALPEGPTVTQLPLPAAAVVDAAAMERSVPGSEHAGSEVELTATPSPREEEQQQQQQRILRSLTVAAPQQDSMGEGERRRSPAHASTTAISEVAAAAAAIAGGPQQGHRHRHHHARRPSAPPRVEYDQLVHMPASEYRRRALADMAAATSFYERRRSASSASERSGGGSASEGEEGDAVERCATAAVSGGALGEAERGSWAPARSINGSAGNGGVPPVPSSGASHPSLPGMEDAIPEDSGKLEAAVAKQPSGLFLQALCRASAPLLLLLKATVPIVESTSYHRPWFVLAMGTSPMFITACMGALRPFSMLVAGAAGAAASAASWLFSRSPDGDAPLWGCNSGFPIGAGLIAVYGFGVAALWINLIASEIVGMLHFFGLLAGVHPAVLGVTVLAWGNSLTDLMGNTAMAARSAGGKSMAMTACYAGPLFNMLVGLGVGFWALLADKRLESTPVRFDPVVAVGCTFVMVNNAVVVAVALLHRHRLPARFGWVMVGWYCVYMAAVCAIAMGGGEK